ncbi:hypothetical protein CW702_00435 [Candidatus Bathyarchaeota archaeon]|nr:MAG: hypothetical protein CW702_00435 [Candidatus Bathyarchaeota archaeon]
MRVFITDCEGPISKNDNAFELSSHYIPGGDRFFAVVSRYDDVLADIVRRPGYKAGDTLKLILPFLKAYGATDEGMKNFSSENILLVPGAKNTLRYVSSIMPSFIVSTSYEHYIRALCEAISFPFSNTYCTRLSIDRYDINDSEATRLRELASEIRDMPVVEIPEDAESIDDLKVEHQAVIKRLDEIFWREISKMRIGGIFRDVNPVGGYEKAKAVRDISSKLNVKLSEVIYVGDSITDVESFRLVRKGGGLTISFNGNAYAVREAEVAVLSSHTVTISILADVFNRGGKERVLELVEDWSIEKIRSLCGSRLADALYKVSKRHPVKVELITPKNMKRLMHESSSFRKNVRGEAVGALG